MDRSLRADTIQRPSATAQKTSARKSNLLLDIAYNPENPPAGGLTVLTGMNQNQAITLIVAAGNTIIIMLFPPFDVYSIATGAMPVFGGFDFYFNRTQYMVVNSGVLILELIVVLINTGIAWLLFGTKYSPGKRRGPNLQITTLVVVAVNLLAILLFPPFESVYAISKATLPTFEGFYFIFSQQPKHVIVTTILYLEVIFVLINGALCWMLFRNKNPAIISEKEAYQLVQEMRRRSK
jgi:hypothetical protein